MKRKSILLTSVLIFVAIACAASYSSIYHIELDEEKFTEEVRAFYCRGSNEDKNPLITLHNSAVIGDTVYYLLEIDQDFGYVKLQKGLNGKYRILFLNYGSGDFDSGLLEHDGRKYLLFGFRDDTAQIAKISVELSNLTYVLDIPANTSRFLFCREIDSKVTEKTLDLTQLSFYNEAGENITGQYRLSSGMFQ